MGPVGCQVSQIRDYVDIKTTQDLCPSDRLNLFLRSAYLGKR